MLLTGCGGESASDATPGTDGRNTPAAESGDSALPEDLATPPAPKQLRVGQTAFWFPDSGGKAKVTLLKVHDLAQGYELPKGVRLQLKVANFGAPPIDPSSLQAEYVTSDGQRFSDVSFSCSLDETTRLNGGEFVKGCMEFDLPNKHRASWCSAGSIPTATAAASRCC